jgi:hypothetical protein
MQIFKRLFSGCQRIVLGMVTEILCCRAFCAAKKIAVNSPTRLFWRGTPKKKPLVEGADFGRFSKGELF